MKLACPGRPTEPRLITTASTAASASDQGSGGVPCAQPIKLATVRYCAGLVIRKSDTASGNTSPPTRAG